MTKIGYLIKFISAINAIFLISCATYDITNDQALSGGYTSGKVFVAQKDLVIDKSGVLVDDDLTLRGAKKGRIPSWFKGVMKKGERLQIERLLFKQHPEIGDSIHPIGLILDGTWRGESVDLYLVSKILKHVLTNRSRYAILTNDPKRFIELSQGE